MHRRTPERLAAQLEEAGLTVDAGLPRRPADTPSPAGSVLAHR